MPLELNTLLLGRYRILSELGRGGMGAVYRGQDENLGVEVAIKENLVESLDFERQFKREAKLLASLRHPGLPRVTDYFVLPGAGQYLVMDFIQGEDAKQRLDREGRPLPEVEVVRWAREILEALNYLHTLPQPIVHRDIKPSNIKITPAGRAVLVDFGLAKIHDAARSTTIGAKALTPGFAPPEQYGLGTGRTDPRTDLYSLGATLYTLLTGQTPADGLERAMETKQLIPVRGLNPSVSPEVSQAIETSLGIRPEDRFASAAEFSAALGAGIAPESTPPAPAPAARTTPASPTLAASSAQPTVMAKSRRRNRALPAALVILLLLSAGGFGLWATGSLDGLLSSAPSPTSPGTLVVVSASTNPPASPSGQATSTRRPSATATGPSAETAVPPTEVPATVKPTQGPTPRGGGGQIAFVSERAGAPQIFLMNVDGSEVKQLTLIPDGACQPAWSPDGQRLLFITPCSGKAERYSGAAIYMMNVDGTDIQPFITLVGGVFDADWSQSGVAFTYLESGQPRVWVANANGGDSRQISQPRASDSHPSWSPDGARLAFVNTSRVGAPIIYWMNKDGSFNGSSPDQVSRDQLVSSPKWASAGDLITYVVDQQIWVVKWDAKGFNAVKLTSKGPNADPDFSPDGQWITLESWRDAANHDIYIMTVNGGLQTRLTDDPAGDYQPAWRP